MKLIEISLSKRFTHLDQYTGGQRTPGLRTLPSTTALSRACWNLIWIKWPLRTGRTVWVEKQRQFCTNHEQTPWWTFDWKWLSEKQLSITDNFMNNNVIDSLSVFKDSSQRSRGGRYRVNWILIQTNNGRKWFQLYAYNNYIYQKYFIMII